LSFAKIRNLPIKPAVSGWALHDITTGKTACQHIFSLFLIHKTQSPVFFSFLFLSLVFSSSIFKKFFRENSEKTRRRAVFRPCTVFLPCAAGGAFSHFFTHRVA